MSFIWTREVEVVSVCSFWERPRRQWHMGVCQRASWDVRRAAIGAWLDGNWHGAARRLERLAARQFSVYALRHQAEVLRRTGDSDIAARADNAATANRDRFAAAV